MAHATHVNPLRATFLRRLCLFANPKEHQRRPSPLGYPGRRGLLAITASAGAEPTPTAAPPASSSGSSSSSAPGPPELEEARFEAMFAQLLEWKEKFYDCIVPRKAFDAGDLGEWVHRLRRLRAQGRVPEALTARLEAVGFAWRVDGITAKWYHNLHVARQYKALHGSAEIPPDFADPSEPDFVEAARWLARQRELYARQKLLRLRVRLLKEALGIRLHRRNGPVRRNLHPVIRREDARFRKELEQRAARQQVQQAAGGGQPGAQQQPGS